MGLAFDDNGNYIGWSSLFDYYNLETIKASEYLPLPKQGVHIEESEDGVDISEEAKIITETDTKLKETIEKPEFIEQLKVTRLKAYASIFNKLGSGTKVKGASKEILKAMNNHNATKLPTEVRAMALRNFISTHIQNTIQNVRNAADSYVPVDMDDLRDAAENSPKGAEALELTLMNPLSIYTMQYQNMTGKNVIAISATGQKAAFMWMYYLNDVINNAKGWQGTYVSTLEDLANVAEKEALVLSENKVYIKFNDKWIPDNGRGGYDYVINSAGQIEALENTDFKFTRFQFDTTRIKGRSKAKKGQPIEPEKVTTTTLPDVNTERLMDLTLQAFIDGGKLKNSIPVDIIISQLISAATDNAKELILPKINAGSKLAKCYLFLMTMGYDINDIVKFMTSNAVSWIDSLSDPNIFLGQNIRIDEAITEVQNYLKNYETNKNTESFEDEFGQAIKGSDKKLKLLKSIIPSNLTPVQVQEALLDIEEFKHIMQGTDEFSAFGQLLSINQGLPGKTEDLEAKLTKIKRIMIKREKDLGILGDNGAVNTDNIPNITDLSRYSDIYGGKFNTTRWLQDKEYRRRVSEYYDKLKVSLNIFAAADYLPHFDSMFQLLGGECTVNEFSVKSRILSACLEKIAREAPKVFLDDKYYSRILGFASQLTMQQFLIDNDFEFPVTGPIINSNRTISNVKNGKINLNTEEGIASFKYYFENVVIPGLRAGTYGDFSDKEKAEIRDNAFISALIRGNDRDVPLWKVNVNLSADSAYTRIQLNNFSKAMQQLTNYKIGDLSVADWFALYNLIVNKNQYGSDRLTKIFEKFVNDFDSKGNNIINRYLKYIGDIDYANTSLDNILNFTAMDMFISQARIVSSTQGQTDPVVIVYENKVPKYYKNVGFGKYEAIPDDEIMATITGESIEQKLHRFYLQRAYFVLGKPYSSFLSRIQNQLDESPTYGIAELMKTSKLFLDMICV